MSENVFKFDKLKIKWENSKYWNIFSIIFFYIALVLNLR